MSGCSLRRRLERSRMLPQETPAPSHLSALIRRHLLPSMVVREHAFALLGRELLKLLIALHDLVALIRRQTSVPIVGLL